MTGLSIFIAVIVFTELFGELERYVNDCMITRSTLAMITNLYHGIGKALRDYLFCLVDCNKE